MSYFRSISAYIVSNMIYVNLLLAWESLSFSVVYLCYKFRIIYRSRKCSTWSAAPTGSRSSYPVHYSSLNIVKAQRITHCFPLCLSSIKIVQITSSCHRTTGRHFESTTQQDLIFSLTQCCVYV